jgi:ABC-2 type transport system permease protein
MNALFALTVANIKSYVRDRAALFWTLAFPLIFIFMFGFILQGGGGGSTLAWVDDDASPASTQLHDAFLASGAVKLVETTEEDALAQMRAGKVDAVIVARKGYGDAVAAGAAGTATAPAAVTVYTDPSRSNVTATVYQIVGSVLGAVNLGGRPPIVVPDARTIQTENLNFISYFVPSMLGLSVMQVGIFAAVPLVADREKLILKRLAATPLRRWQLVGSNVLMRLLIAMVQAIIIVGVGALFFGVQITGSVPLVVGFVVQHHPVPDDVPVGHVLPDRPDARCPAGHRQDHPAHLSVRCPAPGHGQRGRVRATVAVRGRAACVARRVLRDRGAEVPLAIVVWRPRRDCPARCRPTSVPRGRARRAGADRRP